MCTVFQAGTVELVVLADEWPQSPSFIRSPVIDLGRARVLLAFLFH